MTRAGRHGLALAASGVVVLATAVAVMIVAYFRLGIRVTYQAPLVAAGALAVAGLAAIATLAMTRVARRRSR